jgi:hypothetical protein
VPAGTAEPTRPDFSNFTETDLGGFNPNYPTQRFINIRSPHARDAIKWVRPNMCQLFFCLCLL